MRKRELITTGNGSPLARNGRMLALATLVAMTVLTVGCYGRYPWHYRDRDRDRDRDRHRGQLDIPGEFSTAHDVIYP